MAYPQIKGLAPSQPRNELRYVQSGSSLLGEFSFRAEWQIHQEDLANLLGWCIIFANIGIYSQFLEDTLGKSLDVCNVA